MNVPHFSESRDSECLPMYVSDSLCSDRSMNTQLIFINTVLTTFAVFRETYTTGTYTDACISRVEPKLKH